MIGLVKRLCRPLAMYLCLLATSAMAGAQSIQGPSALPSPERDSFVGTWKPNRDLSYPKPSKKDAARYTRTIARDGDERLSKSTDPMRGFRIRCDGQPHYLTEVEATMACLYISSNIVEGATRDTNGHVGYWKEEVSQDGQMLTATTYTTSARSKIERMLVLNRVN